MIESSASVQGEGEGGSGSSYRSIELWKGIQWGKFRDGWPNIFINDVQDIAGRDGEGAILRAALITLFFYFIVIFLASFHDPQVIFEQLSLIYALPRYKCGPNKSLCRGPHVICRYLVRSFRLILPFFPTGTMERVDTEGQVVTAKVSIQ